MPRNEGSGNPDLSQFSEFGACQQICAVWHGLQSHLCCLIQTGPLPILPMRPLEQAFRTAKEGLRRHVQACLILAFSHGPAKRLGS
jgi:hypothetical protein